MNVVTVSEAKHHLEALIAKSVLSTESILIKTDKGEQIVLIPLSEFNAWQETVYLLSNPANAGHLRQSITEARLGKVAERELIEP